MSRIGKSPIPIPQGVEVQISPTQAVSIKGPRGTLTETVPPQLSLIYEGQELSLTRQSEEKEVKSLHGLYRALLNNMVVGVTDGYRKELQLVGVGYKVTESNNVLEINVGKSHLTYFVVPPEIKVKAEAGKRGSHPSIALESHDKQLIGQISAKLCDLRKVEPYKGKGIYPKGMEIRRKAGKKATK